MSNVTTTTLNTTSEASSNIVPYTIAAFGSLLVYDYLCTLADEISLVWLQPWNIGTVLFLLNRYPPFLDTFLSLHALTTVQYPEVCIRNFKAVTWLIVSGVFIAEMILMIRTYAIFQRNRWMKIFLCSLMTLVVVPGCVVVELELQSLHYGYPKNQPYFGCYLTQPPSVVIFIAYVLVLFSETIIVGLTAFKAIQHLRRSRSALVVHLYRNGLLFYVYILLISLANVIVPVVGASELANWLATPQRVLHSIFCTRVLLSILHDRRHLVSSFATSRSQAQMSAFDKFTTILPPSDETSECEGPGVMMTPRGSLDWRGGLVGDERQGERDNDGDGREQRGGEDVEMDDLGCRYGAVGENDRRSGA
ncbi:hypothetical protein BC629DRAFT_1179933 [Irpex lacteus]|nr:hypothetical protein BC629DRAFT_132158 [Irpex lacteus]KAI0804488.1 hypothetical protein BC629DRAFT_1179933 [Irpex lacteus]